MASTPPELKVLKSLKTEGESKDKPTQLIFLELEKQYVGLPVFKRQTLWEKIKSSPHSPRKESEH